jgi:hypothetical protein
MGLSSSGLSQESKQPSTSMDSSVRHVCTSAVLRGLPSAGVRAPSSPDALDLVFSLAGFSGGAKGRSRILNIYDIKKT